MSSKNRYDYRDKGDKGAGVLIPSGYDENGRAIAFTVKKLKPLTPRMSIYDGEGMTEIYNQSEGTNVVWPPNFWWCGDCGSGWSAMDDKSSSYGLLHAVQTGHYVSFNKNHKPIYRIKNGLPFPF